MVWIKIKRIRFIIQNIFNVKVTVTLSRVTSSIITVECVSLPTIENRIYIREELKESLGMNFTNHVNVHKLYAVEYINTVCSLDYPFQFRIF